jgi:BlaI family transcriptional regulator, penicillinase repressor
MSEDMNERSAKNHLSRRERQIMDAVFQRGKATAAEIMKTIPNPSTKDAIRRLIRILEEKGFLRHETDGLRHTYYPTVAPEDARASALDHVIQTHFRGSISQAIAQLLESSAMHLTDEELAQITSLIEDARKEGR